MEALSNLLDSIIGLFTALIEVVVSLVAVALPWLPLIAWVAFWLLAVNWNQAMAILKRGGFIGVVLLMFVATIVWSAVSPPDAGHHEFLGLHLSNVTGKFIYVTILTCIALICGTVQMSGAMGRCCNFTDDTAADQPTA